MDNKNLERNIYLIGEDLFLEIKDNKNLQLIIKEDGSLMDTTKIKLDKKDLYGNERLKEFLIKKLRNQLIASENEYRIAIYKYASGITKLSQEELDNYRKLLEDIELIKYIVLN